MRKLVYASTTAFEDSLDGSDETYLRYFFALYHCSPDEQSGINDLRLRLRQQFPSSATSVGRHFVLFGEAAYQALHWYYGALSQAQSLPENYRVHAVERGAAIEALHKKSQSFGVDLSEGQLSKDDTLEFYAHMALFNGQILFQEKS